MKYAILTDIHGNLPALERVLEHADSRGIPNENFRILGDQIGYGPKPN
jgi:hypothetical protein